jgi:hypothetical protein
MSMADEGSPPISGSTETEGSGRVADERPGHGAASSSVLRGWSLIIGAGILAGLAGFCVGEASETHIRPDLNLPEEIMRSSSQKPLEIERRMGIARDHRTALAYGGLGLFLGLALGAAGGLTRRSARAAIVAGLTGLVLGGVAGAVTTRGVLPYYHSVRAKASDEDKTNDLTLALMTHGAIWGAVGAAAGLALGMGLGGVGRTARASLGGILGAFLGAVIYEFVGAIFFPYDQTFRPMAYAVAPRLLAHLGVAVCTAIGAYGVADYVSTVRAKAPKGPTG